MAQSRQERQRAQRNLARRMREVRAGKKYEVSEAGRAYRQTIRRRVASGQTDLSPRFVEASDQIRDDFVRHMDALFGDYFKYNHDAVYANAHDPKADLDRLRELTQASEQEISEAAEAAANNRVEFFEGWYH